MKKNIGKADKFNRLMMIILLAIAAYFATGILRWVFIAITIYEIYTVSFSHCIVYQLLRLNSLKETEGSK